MIVKYVLATMYLRLITKFYHSVISLILTEKNRVTEREMGRDRDRPQRDLPATVSFAQKASVAGAGPEPGAWSYSISPTWIAGNEGLDKPFVTFPNMLARNWIGIKAAGSFPIYQQWVGL